MYQLMLDVYYLHCMYLNKVSLSRPSTKMMTTALVCFRQAQCKYVVTYALANIRLHAYLPHLRI